MTDKEKFQKTFGKMHASSDILTEVWNMTSEKKQLVKKRRAIPKVAVAAMCGLLVLGTGTVAYAMDAGGIQRSIQIWINGDQTDAVFQVSEGNYTLEYKDADGREMQRGGGGVAINADGTERPLTEAELLQQINAPEVSYNEDGSVWLYYYDQKMDITDKFENDICYIQLMHDSEVLYMTIKYQDGYATSPYKYERPW